MNSRTSLESYRDYINRLLREYTPLSEENGQSLPELLLIPTSSIYIESDLEPLEVEKWLDRRRLSKLESMPIDVLELNGGIRFVYRGCEKLAAHVINGGKDIWANIYYIDEAVDAIGLKTIEDAIYDYYNTYII